MGGRLVFCICVSLRLEIRKHEVKFDFRTQNLLRRKTSSVVRNPLNSCGDIRSGGIGFHSLVERRRTARFKTAPGERRF